MRLRGFYPLCLLAFGIVLGAGLGSNLGAQTITVRGVGEVAQAPDMAIISLSVQEDARNASDAVDEVAEAMRGLLGTLQEIGVEARDLQTTHLRLTPLWEDRNVNAGGRRAIVGFEAASSLQIRVRALDALGQVLDAALAVGVNRFSGLRFDVQNPDEAMEAARAAAMRNAIARATTLAEAAGGRLGDILSISDVDMAAPTGRALAFAEATSVPVAPGELTVSAEVTVEFAFLP